VVVLVVELVVEPTGQRGRPASPVHVQRCALHWLVMFLAQLKSKGAHASLISSLQAVNGSHLPPLSALAEEETKTPAASATLANMTAAPLDNLVIARAPPFGRSYVRIPIVHMTAGWHVPRLRHGCQRIFFD